MQEFLVTASHGIDLSLNLEETQLQNGDLLPLADKRTGTIENSVVSKMTFIPQRTTSFSSNLDILPVNLLSVDLNTSSDGDTGNDCHKSNNTTEIIRVTKSLVNSNKSLQLNKQMLISYTGHFPVVAGLTCEEFGAVTASIW